MLKISGLNLSVKGKMILKSIDMNVEKGMIYGFIGHNGAGKTTTMLSVVGLLKYDSGEIIIDGTPHRNRVTGGNLIGYLPENPGFYDYMSGKEYMIYMNNMSKVANPMDLLEKVGLANSMNKRIGAYSRGMKQRLGMAAAMLGKPKLLILDEPTSALDPSGRYELFEMIKALREEGNTIVLSTHILDDIEKISDRIGIISRGTILKEGNVVAILSDYFNPIFDVEFSGVVEDASLDYFRDLKWVSNVFVEDKTLSITVTDVPYAEKNIFNELVGSQMDIIGFNMRKPSLEDVFLKEVKL